MDYKYQSSVRQLTARPRSKRLRELGGTIVGGGNVNVSVEGGGIAPIDPNGHRHSNLDVLERITTDDQDYICLNEYVEETDPDTGEETGNFMPKKERAKVGFADLAGALAEEAMQKLMEMFLRKDQDDKTDYLLSLLGGAIIKNWAKFGDFVTDIQGGYIDEKGNMEMESGIFRKRLFVPEIAYNRITYFKGRSCISPGGGCTVLSWTDNGDGSYTITPDLTDADALSQFVDDILTTYFIFKNEEGKLQGFEEMKFRVTATDYDAKTFVIVPKPGYDWKPAEQMILAQTGNFTDEERQNYILIDTVNGNSCISFYENANTWDTEPAQQPSWFGKKKGRTVQGVNCDNYSAVLQNILMTGRIFQIDEITGDSIRVPIDKGKWEEGMYGYFDRVTHSGCLWLCINEEGTGTEPSDNNPNWLKQVEKGSSMQSMGEWRIEKTPFPANSIVTLAGGAFIAKTETYLPPVAIWKTDTDTYAMTDDGVYALMGSWDEYGHKEAWDVLFDVGTVVNGKDGTSIVFVGAYSTAPTNPKEGWCYYSTSDKCAYVYQENTWRLMVQDGKDGKDYEHIYIRTKLEEQPAQPYSDPDADDYIPPGWSDDYQGITEEYRYEWACKRVKRDGKWGDFSTAALVYRWADRGADGNSITPVGEWNESILPVIKGGIVSFAGSTFVAKNNTYLPPIAIWKVDSDTYARMEDGSYAIMGSFNNYGHKDDWMIMVSGEETAVSYSIECPITAVHFTSTGSPSPSAFLATCKKSYNGKVMECSDLYLAARRYKDGVWSGLVGATRASSISVPASAGYTQFCIRAYKTEADANTWNSLFLAEKGVSVAIDGAPGKDGKDGKDGADGHGEPGAFPYDCGVWKSGTSYVWNVGRRDKVIHMFDGVYYNFIVRNYGATVTAAPTSALGDTNWEAMNKFVNIATDTLFADGANVAGFMFKGGVMRSQQETGGVPNMILNGNTGYFRCSNAEITGKINATSGSFNNVNFVSGKMAGFNVSGTSIYTDTGVYDGGSGVNGYSSSKFFLHASGADSAFIGFSATGRWVGIGLNTLPGSTGLQAMGRFEDTGSTDFTFTKIGLFISVSGAATYDNAGMHGNSALYIPKGHITGFRRRLRRVSVSTTLTVMDSTIVCCNTGTITITLPSNAEDGQEYWLTSANGKRVNVTSSCTITGNGSSFTSNQWHVYVFDAYNKLWIYG